MEINYISDKLEAQCTIHKQAQKLFDGDKAMAVSLLSRINALKSAETIKDIIVQPIFHFHSLKNKDGHDLEGYFAIDVRHRIDPWRIILQPLDENGEAFVPCHIDEISGKVRIVKIEEVSKHYE